MRGYEIILNYDIEDVNVEDHCLCSSCKGVFDKDDCSDCRHCGGFTCEGCAEKGEFTCCLQACLESAEIEGERILELGAA